MDLKTLINRSGKLKVAISMINQFKKEGHKTLLFSKSTQQLDIIQYVLEKQNKASFDRIDGDAEVDDRKTIIESFQKGKTDVLLLSKGAGGVGITLTRASRVILFDPDWNPTVDKQAADRAHRIGQKQELRVYRLHLAGSIEEKVYEKQLQKIGMEKTILTTGPKCVEKRFDKHELCKALKTVPDSNGNCELMKKFKEEGVPEVPNDHDDIVFLRNHKSVVDVSFHEWGVFRQKRKAAFCNASRCSKRSKLE